MLSLSDPLWPKLYHAYGYEDLPGLLGQFRSKPDREALTEFLFGSLIHQETCYPATYACAPHLLEIATTTAAVDVRKTVIAFLAWLIVCAFDEDSLSGPLAGIPPDHEAWLDKICVYNGSQARRPTRRDFDALQSLSIDFRAIIPKIGALCEQAFLDENGNAHAALQWLAGVVAAGGHPRLARIFEFGGEGWTACAHCGAKYEFVDNRGTFHIYRWNTEADAMDARSIAETPLMLDYEDGSPNRYDTVVTPLDISHVGDFTRVLKLAADGHFPGNYMRLRNCLGTYSCVKCLSKTRIGIHFAASG